MECFELTQIENGIRIEGFPDAVKVVKLDNPNAKKLADFTLHHADLRFAKECLDGTNNVSEEPQALREGLWRAAIIHFMKCFGKSRSRFSLDASVVYKGDDGASAVFGYFKALRNKHLVHDENSYAQCLPSAILNKRESSHKIAKIVCNSVLVATLVQGNYSNLYRLTTLAQDWVTKQFDDLCNLLVAELETKDYDELLSGELASFRAPAVDEVYQKRE